MKILINAATAVVGGGAQVAAGLIESTLKEQGKNTYFYTVSPLVEEQIKSFGLAPKNLISLKHSPAKIRQGASSRQKLLEIESKFHPDIIYSIAAPSYVKFKSTIEVARITEPWITHPNKWCYSKLSFYKSLKTRLLVSFKVWKLRHIQHFNTQTETSAEGLYKRLNLPPTNVKVIPNCPNEIFTQSRSTQVNEFKKENTPTILALGHPYLHKSFDILPHVCKELKKMGKQIQFVVTFPKGNTQTKSILDKASSLGVNDMIHNAGKLTLPMCKQRYIECDAVFLPTLLETSSVTFLEAMAMSRPIITTNLDFSRTACGNAAEYFEPCNAKSAANAIINVLEDENRKNELIENGTKQIARNPSQEETCNAHIEWVKSIANQSLRQQ